MTAQILTGWRIQGTRDPFKVTVPSSTDLPDLTGATVGCEVYTADDGVRRTFDCAAAPSSSWAFEQTGTPAAAGDPLVILVTPPTAGYPLGGFTFPALRNSAGGAAYGFTGRVYFTMPGEAAPRWSNAFAIVVDRRDGRP